MAEYRRQIILGAASAIFVGVVLAIGIANLPLQTASPGTNYAESVSTSASTSQPASITATTFAASLSLATTVAQTQSINQSSTTLSSSTSINQTQSLTTTPSAFSTCPISPHFYFNSSNPSLVSSGSNHTFTVVYNFTASDQSATVYYNGTLSYLTEFSGDPQWQFSNGPFRVPTNKSAIASSANVPFYKLSSSQFQVISQPWEITTNPTGEISFFINVTGLPTGYYGIMLNVYVEFSSYPNSCIPSVSLGYIPLRVVSS